MIEAVNAVVSNSQILRSVAEQTSTTQVLSANPSRIQAAAITAPYLSPHVDYNGAQSKPIFVVRDAATGETIKQFPSEAQIRAYAKAAAVREQMVAQSQFQNADNGAAEAAALRSADVAKSSVEFKVARQAVRQQQEPAVFKSESVKTIGSTDTAQFKSVGSVDTQA